MDLNALTTQINREHDACGIFSSVEKSGLPTHRSVLSGVQALKALRHRAGYVQGEGDGCGLLLDIPRLLWQKWLAEAGVAQSVVHDPTFFVGHLFLRRRELPKLIGDINRILEKYHLTVLVNREGEVDEGALGPLARAEDIVFVQVAGTSLQQDEDAALYHATTELEFVEGVHVASLGRTSVVYKVVGDGDTLWNYYIDLRDPYCQSVYVLAHTRYSTNTATSLSRVQPFAHLGHNGEINTITRFFSEAGMLGIDLDPRFSDSQMVDGAIHAFVGSRGWSLFEVVELLFPPIINEIKQMSAELSDMYMFLRSLWGPFAQGPAAIMMRFGDTAVYSVDALGLRPMWQLETATTYCFCSEQGIVPLHEWTAEPKPIAPGEKLGVLMADSGSKLIHYDELQAMVLESTRQRFSFGGEGTSIHFTGPYPRHSDIRHPSRDAKPLATRAAAFGWRDEDYRMVEFEARTSAEPIRSLGYDGPLPALDDSSLRSLADFLQETVAVVTNPAIDREREIEHFSTRTVLGKRPSFTGLYHDAKRLEIGSPLLLEGLPDEFGIGFEEIQTLAHRYGTLCHEDALSELRTTVYGTVEILVHREPGESVQAALERFNHEALEAVSAGANVIVLDDRLQFARGRHVDPLLAVASVHKSLLRPASSQGGEHLRRRTSIILRSGGLRNLHDIMAALGVGADAVTPYLMWETAASKGHLQALENLYAALCKGVEKVISTLGIHELRGYERLLGSIGLDAALASILGVPNFCGGPGIGFGFADLEHEAERRQDIYDAPVDKKLTRHLRFQLYPRIWKSAGLVAQGVTGYDTFAERLAEFERDAPISLRHVLQIAETKEAAPDASLPQGGPSSEENAAVKGRAVDTTVDGHAYPLVISSMSFGSQSETAYRAYAEAAYQMNIVCLNGEGGEIKDLLDKYPKNRGRQIASGRFGVNAELCNDAYVLEIKIGQGAKPGEGGHLPGSKVTMQVANARNAAPGVDLISPSNNHDIYSIEDLAQVIFELRQINPKARVSVKVPVVPNIGTIAVGIVKAGADIVNLSGFDGGTGAARMHAIRHVGFPVEIGLKAAHEALCAAGLRDVAEIWVDGGMKSGTDVMKAILLGANRVGFGTMAMVAIGCTACRSCHTDTCHVGIATQLKSVEEATERGVKVFVPREFTQAVTQLTTLFTAIGDHVGRLTARLGAKRTQDLVGRSDLLHQVTHAKEVDLSWLVSVRPAFLGKGTRVAPRDWMAEEASAETASQELAVAVGTSPIVGAQIYRPRNALHIRPTAGSAEKLGDTDLCLSAVDRALGTHESGERTRNRTTDARLVHVYPHVTGNGFAAYHTVGMYSIAEGGAQDGVGKAAYGGRIVVLKQKCQDGVWRGGSVGKSLAYGASHGVFIIQGNADARAGIRLSGADVVIGGELVESADDTRSFVGATSNIKGFAFEYMTAGRALVLGDPGPWICSGMTGGSVYLRYEPSLGLTEEALRRRIAKGAKVTLRPLDREGVADVTELLHAYLRELRRSGQSSVTQRIVPLLERPAEHFVVVRPGRDITDQTIATE